jgi:tetratricopeptide (TPR) repeat protein
VSRARPSDLLHGLAAALLAFAAYAGTLGHELVWDDPALVESARNAVQSGGLGALLRAEFVLDPMSGESTGYYRPVVLASLRLDSWLSDALTVPTYHATNVLLHAAATWLVWLLARTVLATQFAAAAAALLFAVHPVHTESVAFVSGRTDLLASLFALAATWAWLRRHVAASSAALLLAALSKESAFVLPAVLLAWDAVRTLGSGARTRRWPARNVRWAAAWGAALVLAAALRAGAGVGFGTGESAAASPAHQAAAWTLHLRLLVLPWPLNAQYAAADLAPSAASLGGAALLLAACAAAAPARHGRLGALALIWIVGFLLPISGLLAFSAADVAERFLYLPSVGFALLFGHWAAHFAVRLRRAAVFAAVLVLGLGAAATIARSRIWKDNATLYADIARTTPRSALAHSNLGLEHLRAGRHDEAAAAFERATSLQPDFALAWTNLGLARRAQGRAGEALAAFERAAALAPDHPGVLMNLGNEYRRAGRPADAAAVLERAARGAAASADLRFLLGTTYADLGRLDDAAAALEEAVRLRPQAPDGHYRLGLVSLARGDSARARQAVAALATLHPESAARLQAALDVAQSGPPPLPAGK